MRCEPYRMIFLIMPPQQFDALQPSTLLSGHHGVREYICGLTAPLSSGLTCNYMYVLVGTRTHSFSIRTLRNAVRLALSSVALHIPSVTVRVNTE